MICHCDVPIPAHEGPHGGFTKTGTCIACGLKLPPDSILPFFDRLAEARMGPPPEEFNVFRLHCESRHGVGRGKFGYRFYRRDNLRDATEEAADGANYMAYEQLVNARTHPQPDDNEDHLLLIAADHFFQAFQAIVRYQHRRNGEP